MINRFFLNQKFISQWVKISYRSFDSVLYDDLYDVHLFSFNINAVYLQKYVIYINAHKLQQHFLQCMNIFLKNWFYSLFFHIKSTEFVLMTISKIFNFSYN